jgi:hypothetical protein
MTRGSVTLEVQEVTPARCSAFGNAGSRRVVSRKGASSASWGRGGLEGAGCSRTTGAEIATGTWRH